MCISIWRECSRRMDQALCGSARQQDKSNGQKLMHRSSTWTWGIIFYCVWPCTGTEHPERVWSLPPQDIFQNHLGTILCNALQDNPTWAGRLNQVTHCGTFQPNPFYEDIEAHKDKWFGIKMCISASSHFLGNTRITEYSFSGTDTQRTVPSTLRYEQTPQFRCC